MKWPCGKSWKGAGGRFRHGTDRRRGHCDHHFRRRVRYGTCARTSSEAQRLEGVSIKHDVSVPVSQNSRLPSIRRAKRFRTRFRESGGRLRPSRRRQPALQPFEAGIDSNTRFIESTPAVNRIVHDLVASVGGSISAEHGLGQLKRDEILRYRSADETAMMLAVKQLFDPQGLMNPGKVI